MKIHFLSASIALAIVAAHASGCSNDHTAPISCISSRECSAAGLVCDLDAELCVQCVVQTDCLGDDEVCMAHECRHVVPCVSSRECPGLVCDPVAGFCVECVVDPDCGTENRCVDHACVPRPTACASDGVCVAQNQVCDVAAGICVDCVRDADCPSGSRCEADRMCRPGDRDAGPVDAGEIDAASVDAGRTEMMDAWIAPSMDSGTFDAGILPMDGGAIDAFTPPVDAALVDAFSPPIDAGPAVVYGVTGFRADYTVPAGVTSLLIVAEGASGGAATLVASSVLQGGYGARVSSIVSVTPGETLTIVVGEQPGQAPYGMDGCGGSGGGASFVVRGAVTALIVAGGGGGAGAYAMPLTGGDASLTTSGGTSGTALGGTGGLGGGVGFMEGGGGGGLTGAGADGEGLGGASYLAGSAGGVRAFTEMCGTGRGGFGGGGGGGNDYGGAGGGYSGGGAQDGLEPSGGGGSYASGTSTSITLRTTHGPGSVTITAL
jgi:hypothetical protein